MRQGSPEWFAARCGCIGASIVADVIATIKGGEAASRANLRARLVVERLTGQPQETYTNGAIQWGTETEPEARAAYECATGEMVDEVGWIPHPVIAGSGCSPDGMVGDAGLLEIKCPGSSAHLRTLLDRVAPSKYIPQMQWQMACTGRAWCDFVSYDPRMPEHLRLFVVRVERDEAMIAKLEHEVAALLVEVQAMIDRLSEVTPAA